MVLMVKIAYLIASHLSSMERLDTLSQAVDSCLHQTGLGFKGQVYVSLSNGVGVKAIPAIRTLMNRHVCQPIYDDVTWFLRLNHQCSQMVHVQLLFSALLTESTLPDFVVLLDDDDWLEPAYTSEMLSLEGSYRTCNYILHGEQVVGGINYAYADKPDFSGTMMSIDVFKWIMCKMVKDRIDITWGMADLHFTTCWKDKIHHPVALVNLRVGHYDDMNWRKLNISGCGSMINVHSDIKYSRTINYCGNKYIIKELDMSTSTMSVESPILFYMEQPKHTVHYHLLEYIEFNDTVDGYLAFCLVNHQLGYFKKLKNFEIDIFKPAQCFCGRLFYHAHWDHCRECNGVSIETSRHPIWYTMRDNRDIT